MEADAKVAAPMLTTDQYFKTPESLLPAEVIYGALRVAEAPSVRHQQALGAFHLALAPHVLERSLGTVLLSPIDVVFDDGRALILQPDLIFVSRQRQAILQRQRVMGAPDLVLEVLSPNPRIGTLQERVGWFAEYGVREVWLLHQDSDRFEILTAAGGGVIAREIYDFETPLRSAVLPSFTRSVSAIMYR